MDSMRCVLMLALLVSCGPTGPIARATAPPHHDGPLTLRPIEFATVDYYIRPKVVEAEEGWLRVPESRDGGSSRTITIHFVRFRSTAQNPGSPIVYLAGGPGGSGTYSAAGDRFDLFMALREVADVIALDQRGVVFTDPQPDCPGSWSYPLERP